FSPSSAWTCPRRTDKVTSLITLTGPKDLETLTSCKTVSSVWSGIKCTSFLVLGRKFNGFTGDQPGLYQGYLRRGFTGQTSHSATKCRAAHLFDVLVNNRHRRWLNAHEDEVIKAHESNLLTDVHVFPIQRLQSTKGHHGVAGDNGRGLLL